MAITRRPDWRDVARRPAAVLAVALAARLLLLAGSLHAPPYSDEKDYHELAVSLAEGHGLAVGPVVTARRPPAWPFALSLLYRVTGPSPPAARVLQVGLGVGLVGIVMLLAGLTAPGDQRVRTVAGWWAALSPTFLHYSVCLFGETIFGILLGLSLYCLLRAARENGRWTARAGLLLGLTCLARGTTLLLLPLASLWLWRMGTGPSAMRRAVVMALVAGCTIAPWTIRNKIVVGTFAVVESNATDNLMYGNSDRTPFLAPWRVVTTGVRPAAERLPGDHRESGAPALRAAARYIGEHPGRFLAWTLLIKPANLWGLSRDLPSGLTGGLYGPPTLPTLALATAVSCLEGWLLLGLGVLGLAWSRARDAAGLEYLVCGYLTFAHSLSFAHSRFRFGSLILLTCFASAAACDLAATPRADRPSRLRSSRAALAVLCLLTLVLAWDVVFLELLPAVRGERPILNEMGSVGVG